MYQDETHPSSVEPIAANTDTTKLQKRFAFLVLLSALFLAVSIMVVSLFFHHISETEFNKMSIENLNAYTTAQRENIHSRISSIQSSLETLALMIGQGEQQDFIDPYLMGLNKDNPDIYYIYTSSETFEEGIRSHQTTDTDIEILNHLKNGEAVVSDIVYSERRGNIYCFAVGVPVFRNGEFLGALRGILNAQELVSTSIYPPALGRPYQSILLDSSGDIIQTDASRPATENIYELLAQHDIQQNRIEELRLALQANEEVTESFRLGKQGRTPLYLSVTDLGYNDWHFAVAIQADQAAMHSGAIVQSVIAGTLVLLAIVVLFCLIVLKSIEKMQKRFSSEERRYLLLEQFSDTILFDYNCIDDSIRFTPNADRLFRINYETQFGFLANLRKQNIYKGDMALIHQLLTGALGTEESSVNVRLLNPEKDEYFWCRIQFRYLTENGRLLSVIGKITDVDEQRRHEEHLKEISELDGLTRIYNKVTAEARITSRLATDTQGYFFMIDIDNFKNVNDLYGHSTGDKVLRYLSESLKRIFSSDTIIGRAGGDEMIVYADHLDGRDDAGKQIEQMSAAMRDFPWKGTFAASLSIGVACYPDDASDYSGLYEAADKAMYQAKKHGKKSWCFYDQCSTD